MTEKSASRIVQHTGKISLLVPGCQQAGGVYPDLKWYIGEGERKGLPGRCPYGSILRCPRYFYTAARLSDERITARMSAEDYDAASAKWRDHELASEISETETLIMGRCYLNFCPEVCFDTFRIFASTLIRKSDDPTDQVIAERLIADDPIPDGKDWRYAWKDVEPLHYSNCPFYAKLHQEKRMSNITFNGPVSGNVNVAGHSITEPVMLLSIAELLTKIETSNVPAPEREAAKSKLAEFLAHPVVAAIIGGLAGKIGG